MCFVRWLDAEELVDPVIPRRPTTQRCIGMGPSGTCFLTIQIFSLDMKLSLNPPINSNLFGNVAQVRRMIRMGGMWESM